MKIVLGAVRRMLTLPLSLVLNLTVLSFVQAFSGTAAAQTGPHIYLQERQTLAARYEASGHTTSRVAMDQAQPRSLTSGDFDEDGIVDLIVGYATAGDGGSVVFHRGNLDAFAPQSQESWQAIGEGRFPAPFVQKAKVFPVPLSPDFVASGNFMGQGHLDLIVASRSSNAIYVLAGDGHGQFAAPQALNLPGVVTAMGAGSLRSRSLFPSLVVGVRNQDGAALLLYRGSNQGLKLAGQIALNGPVSSVVFSDGNGSQAAVLVNGQVSLIHTAPFALEPVSFPVSVSALTFGRFIFDRDTRLQMALLDSQGDVHIAAYDSFDPRPYSLMERRLALQGARRGRGVLPSAPMSPGWQIVESISAVAPFSSPVGTPLLFRTRLSNNCADDVVALNSSTGQMAIVSHPDVNEGATTFVSGQVSLRSYSGSPVAALPLRVNIDGRPGIVALHQGETAPSAMMPLPDPTFTVNTTNDTVDANPGNGICADAGGFCSLRAAIMEANATAGTDTIMVPAGTFTLTLPRVAGDFSAAHGTLDVTDSVNIIGAGQASTIIQAGTTSSNGVDKVFSFNQDISILTNATVSISNLTIRNGNNRGDATSVFDGYGGAFDFDTGASGTANLTVTSCTITDNKTNDGDGGGIAIFNFAGGAGSATISNSIIQNNTVQESSTGGSGIGGGIFVAATGALVLSNTQILNNNAVQPTGQGGGLFVYGPSLVAQQTKIHTSTISGNHASAQGGGIYTTAGLLIDQGTVISNNQSGADGGGLWYNTIGETTAITKATITGNIATGNGGGIQVDISNSGNILTMQYSRIAGNSAAVGRGLNNIAGTVNATNNWWGTNSPAGVIGGTVTFDPFIVLTHTASPSTIRINQSTTLTGSLAQDNHGSGAALVGNLDVLSGLPITFNNPVLGTIPQAQPETLNASAQATATFNAGGASGAGHADAVVDQQTTTANITVLQPPSITKSFNPITVVVNAPSTLTFSITNGNTVPIDASFTDSLPANLVSAIPTGAVNNCGGTFSNSLPLPATSFSFNNPALPVGTCTIQVNVQSVVDGVYANSVTIASADAGNGNSSSASLTVINPPAITKAFGATQISLNGATSLTFTITSTNTNLTLNGVAFTDNLPAGLIVATPGNLNTTCSGTATAADGASSVSLSGASVAPGASCTISVSVQGTTAGVKNNSVQVSSTNGGTGNTSNASVGVVGPPLLTKAFGVASIRLNDFTTLTFTITNPNATFALNWLAFTDNLPAGLVVATPNGLSGSCGAGTITATAGSGVVSLINGAMSPGGSCAFSVNVTGITAGPKNNTTGNIASQEGGTGGPASASINVVAPPSIAKAFGVAAMPLNGTTSLTFTITNPAANTVAETGVAFTDSLPAGLVVSTPNALTNTCGGTATAVAGSGSISLTGGTIAAITSCTVVVNVTGTTSGQYTNTTGSVSSTNGGTGNTATANLTVASAPAITKAFGAVTIPLNGTTSLTFTVNNPNTGLALNGVAYTDNLPAGLVVATPNALTNTCGGTATAVAGAGSVSLSGGTIALSASCTISVNINGTTAGVKNNSVQVTSTEGGTGNTSNASITVVGPPVIIKAFGAASISLNGSTSLSFTIQNNNTTTSLTGIGFSDTLPAGLVVSTPSGLTGSCGAGTVTATQATNVISLSGATLAQSTSCTFSVNVTGTSAGTKNNTTGNVTSTEGGAGGTASASINVVAPPSIAKAFGAVAVPLNGTTSLTFTITNPAANAVAETGVAFTDNLPAGLVVSMPNALTNTCGGTATAVAGSGSVSLTGGTIAASSSCALTVNITGTASGNFINTTGSVSSTNGGTGNTATANLSVATPPTITKAFGAASIPLNGSTSLTFTITNPAANTIGLTGVAFTDNLPAGLVVATPNGLTNTCGGTATAVAGAGSASLSSGLLAVNSSCAISVNITGTTAGVKNNSVQVTSTEGGTGNTSNASITVAAPPVIIKAFGAASIPLNGSTSLTFTIQNNNPTTTLTGIGFSDTLPVGLVVATPNGLTGSCGGGTITATQATNVISLSGATLAQSTSCTFSVNVTGTSAGTKNNTTGNVTSTEGGAGGTASASINVVAPPSIAKAFGAVAVPLNGTPSLTLTITNPAANAVAETGVAFTDTLPAGLVVATPNALTNTCGGTATAVAGSGSVSLTGGTIAASSSCTLTVNVTATTQGVKNNSVQVTSTNGGTGNTASASLSVASPPTITKAFGAASVPLNGSTSLTFTITNPAANAIGLTGIAFTDNLIAGLVVATPNGLTNTCGGTATAVAGAGSASLAGGTLAVNSSCVVSLNITGTTVGVKNNSVQVTSTEGGVGNTSNASITVAAPPVIIKAFGAASIPMNGSTSLTFTIQNNNTTSTLTGIGFSDSMPAGLVVATPNGLTGSCGGGTITATQGANTISLSSATLAQSSSCSFSVNVTGTAGGVQNNTTGNVTSTEGGTGGTASASVTVLAPDLTTASSHAGNFRQGQTGAAYTLTASNAGAAPTSGTVTVTDALPASLTATAISGTGWTCTLGTLTCTRADVLANGSSYPAITLTVNVANNAPSAITNTVTISGGSETNLANDTATDSTTVIQAADLTVTSSHVGSFIQSLSGTYDLTVNNPGPGPTVGTVTVTDTLPASLTATAISGTGWTCTLATLTCTRADVLANGSSYPAITLTVNIAGNAPASVTNTVTVSGGGELNTANDSGSDVTMVQPALVLTSLTPTQTVVAGNPGNFNLGLTAAAGIAGPVTFTCSTLPTGAACSFLPVTATPSTTQQTIALTITTSPKYLPVTTAQSSMHKTVLYAALMFPVMGIMLLGFAGKDRKTKWARMLVLLIVASFSLTISSCAGGANRHRNPNATPPSTYSITVTAANATSQAQTQVTIIVQ